MWRLECTPYLRAARRKTTCPASPGKGPRHATGSHASRSRIPVQPTTCRLPSTTTSPYTLVMTVMTRMNLRLGASLPNNESTAPSGHEIIANMEGLYMRASMPSASASVPVRHHSYHRPQDRKDIRDPNLRISTPHHRDFKTALSSSPPTTHTMSRRSNELPMRIAIAGAGGFAQILAQQIGQTAHALLVLSTRVRPWPRHVQYSTQLANLHHRNTQSSRSTAHSVR